MASADLQTNLRLLCSYGRSTSDVCRKAGLNRQQFNKYLNGHATPSLSTLRRICDFFGVEEHEILLPDDAFREIVRLRPPQLGRRTGRAEAVMENLTQFSPADHALLETHKGYYHTYIRPDPDEGYLLRSLTRLYNENDRWLTRTIDRRLARNFLMPDTIKYSGIVLQANRRISIVEREEGRGRSLWNYMLYCSDYQSPTLLSGLCSSIETGGRSNISCVRIVWQFLGRKPDFRSALGNCGIVDPAKEDVPETITRNVENTVREGEAAFSPRV